jgi:hypothetical protein
MTLLLEVFELSILYDSRYTDIIRHLHLREMLCLLDSQKAQKARPMSFPHQEKTRRKRWLGIGMYWIWILIAKLYVIVIQHWGWEQTGGPLLESSGYTGLRIVISDPKDYQRIPKVSLDTSVMT